MEWNGTHPCMAIQWMMFQVYDISKSTSARFTWKFLSIYNVHVHACICYLPFQYTSAKTGGVNWPVIEPSEC